MGWNPVKDLGKATKHVTHAVTSLAKGDVSKAITYAGKTFNDWSNFLGAGEMWDRTQTGVGKIFGGGSGGNGETPDTTSPEQQIVDAKADSLKRRRKLYATSGGSKGEEVESVGDTFGNGRGTLFGN